MRRTDLSTLVLLLAGSALFVDMFLRWAGEGGGHITGWETPIASYAGLSALVLASVEFVRMQGIWRTRASSLLGFFLGEISAVLTISALVHLHWNGFSHVSFGSYCYGPWVGLVIGVVLFAGALIRLKEHRGAWPTT